MIPASLPAFFDLGEEYFGAESNSFHSNDFETLLPDHVRRPVHLAREKHCCMVDVEMLNTPGNWEMSRERKTYWCSIMFDHFLGQRFFDFSHFFGLCLCVY